MYAGSGFRHTLESDEEYNSSDFPESSHHSSVDDSENELKAVEELLYSQVHYLSNESYRNEDDAGVDDIVVSTVEKENQNTGCDELNEFDVHDGLIQCSSKVPATIDAVICSASSDSSVINVDNHRTSSLETPEKVVASKKKCLKINGFDFIVLDSDEESLSCDNLSGKKQKFSESVIGDYQMLIDDVSSKRQKCITSMPLVTVAKTVATDSSSSESSYHAFCFDESSIDSSTSADDTKINFLEGHGEPNVSELKKVLASLPECNWEVTGRDLSLDTNQSRYYQSRARCLNCSARGHLAVACPLPKKVYACLLCGKRGHMAHSCSQSLCFVCHTSGHVARECSNRKRRFDCCRRCGVRGHNSMVCPDKWRQYHMTTNGDKVIKGDQKPNEVRFCYNCSGKGHFGHECREERMNRYSFASVPFVAQYEGVDSQTFREDKNRHKDRSQDSKNSRKKPVHGNLSVSVGAEQSSSDTRRNKFSADGSFSSKRSRGKTDERSRSFSDRTRTCDGRSVTESESDFPRGSKKYNLNDRSTDYTVRNVNANVGEHEKNFDRTVDKRFKNAEQRKKCYLSEQSMAIKLKATSSGLNNGMTDASSAVVAGTSSHVSFNQTKELASSSYQEAGRPSIAPFKKRD